MPPRRGRAPRPVAGFTATLSLVQADGTVVARLTHDRDRDRDPGIGDELVRWVRRSRCRPDAHEARHDCAECARARPGILGATWVGRRA